MISIDDYIRAARSFLVVNGMKGTKNFDDDRLRFMEAIQFDIINALQTIDSIILQSHLPARNSLAKQLTIALYVISVAVLIAVYSVFFSRLVAERDYEMITVVRLLHMVPQSDMQSNLALLRL
ncbi:hypothetical protein M427DRAFT_375831 [Gonapodya prolifera JEL478]|uniref:Uncharacterized protein n=1 Tax=Gonapodya prolifera (strain JEL478) TaxID=1344416 RepID=A0A139AUP2_GONPJ|nr:hypothetical protein M427DRAFT_375831 [Gonapodya prolifera JEL478]|eukprot:KXS20451.1 hypothetical protein M427DRAFT_375831 [Gonapodya prolifera JEL478]